MTQALITQLNVYPIKSCAGISLDRVTLERHGFPQDRHWMLLSENRRFLTQRELPQLALILPELIEQGLRVSAPGLQPLTVLSDAGGTRLVFKVWNDDCAGFDAGDEAASWFSQYLSRPVRLVRFDATFLRDSSHDWTGGVQALNAFSDGFPVLVISEASLADLNSRLEQPLPMNRFRPNIVIGGVEPYGEDNAREFATDRVSLRIVKPCTRCTITTVDQSAGVFTGAEPLKTLRSYRWSSQLRGVMFGQNVIIVRGVGQELHVGQTFRIS